MSDTARKLTSRQIIAALCHANGLPVPEFEHRFHAVRRWRFDAAWPPVKVSVEVEGGVFTTGRHTRGAGYLGDLEKYNTAAIEGWIVLRYTPKQIASGCWVEDVQAAMQRAA